MKILQLTKKFPYPPKDGGAIAKFNFIRGYYDLGHQVTVLALNTKKHYTRVVDLPRDVKKLATFIDVPIDTTITVGGLLKNLFRSKDPYIAERFISKEYIEVLTDLLKKQQFDIIQLEGLYLCPYIDTIKKYTNAPIALRAHNIEHEIWQRTAFNASNPLKKWYLSVLWRRLANFEKQYINQYDLLVPITERDQQAFAKLGNTKPSFVSQTGVSENFTVSQKKQTNKNTIFHLGGLDWAPNQEGLIWFSKNVWPKIKDMHPELSFMVAGRNAPKSLVSVFKANNVDFIGEVDDAVSFMDEHNIMVVPLFSGSGMRIKIVEGMARGKVIISTPIGMEGIGCSPDVNILEANTIDEFVDHINHAFSDTNLCTTISANAKEFVDNNFKNTVLCDRLISFYRKNLNA